MKSQTKIKRLHHRIHYPPTYFATKKGFNFTPENGFPVILRVLWTPQRLSDIFHCKHQDLRILGLKSLQILSWHSTPGGSFE